MFGTAESGVAKETAWTFDTSKEAPSGATKLFPTIKAMPVCFWVAARWLRHSARRRWTSNVGELSRVAFERSRLRSDECEIGPLGQGLEALIGNPQTRKAREHGKDVQAKALTTW